MKIKILLLALSLSISALIGCKGGSKNSSASTALTQEEMIDLFLENAHKTFAYVDSPYEVVLKTDTEMGEGWFVSYDEEVDMYWATYLGPYSEIGEAAYAGQVGAELYDFLYKGTGLREIEVTPVGDGTYVDVYGDGFVFEKGGMSNYDEELGAALVDAKSIQKSANFLVSEYGLPQEKADHFSKLIHRMAVADKRSLTAADYDNFTYEVLGSYGAAERYQNAIGKYLETGDNSELELEIEKTSQFHKLAPDQVKLLIEKQIFSN